MKYLLFLLGCSVLCISQGYAYPGCPVSDMIIGGQIWASCNATNSKTSSSESSGWFTAGAKHPTFLSQNGFGSFLYDATSLRIRDVKYGPCASGYRLPTRGEWETAIWYARLNQTTLSRLLGLPQNGAYRVTTVRGKTTSVARANVLGAYWSSTIDDLNGVRPVVVHIGGNFRGYTMDATVGAYEKQSGYTWERTETGLELVSSDRSELANVRCIAE